MTPAVPPNSKKPIGFHLNSLWADLVYAHAMQNVAASAIIGADDLDGEFHKTVRPLF